MSGETLELESNERLTATIATLERQLAGAQVKLEAVQKEIHTVTHLNKKACGHAVCGLARRVARILKEHK